MKKVAILGAGTMGSGIGYDVARSGYLASLFDVSGAVLEKARSYHEGLLKRAVEKGRMSEGDASDTRSRLSYTTSEKECLEGADIVIEAVPENLELKKEVFGKIEELAPDHAILGTNTSSLSITGIASELKNPERVVGIHFFNPVPVMKLVEIVKGLTTSQDTVAKAVEFARSLGKTTVVVNDSPGFVTTRIGLVLIAEGIRVYEAGVASMEDIDTAMKLGYNMPMGPFELADLIGLDVVYNVLKAIYAELGDPRYAPPFTLKKYVTAGKLGRKTGEGFYRYEK